MNDACPQPGELASLLNDRLDDDERDRLETHVGGCETCQRALLDLAGEIDAIVQRDKSPAHERDSVLPPSLLDRLKQIARTELLDRAAEIAAAEKSPPVIPGLELDEEIGRGGTAIIYKARQTALNRLVAVKVIPLHRLDPESLQRNRRGVEALAGLAHPGIVQVFEVGRNGDCVYGMLEYMAGGNLKHRLHGSPWSPAQAARLVQTITEAVQFMHQRGIVHRDLKTSNVLLTADGSPKIADFGLAKRWDAPDDLTRSGEIMGTPAYMAPEQAASGTTGVAADVYSLGIILYELLTGRTPFRGETTLDTLYQVVHLAPMPPTRFAPQTPRDLETICLKCLRKEPEGRYASAQELADDLGRFLRGEPIHARPVPPTERLTKWLRRRLDLAFALGAFILVTIVGITFLLIERGQLHRAIREESEIRTRDAVKLDDAIRLLDQARLALARNAIAANKLAEARDLLILSIPKPGEPDRRDAEWHDLWRRCEEK